MEARRGLLVLQAWSPCHQYGVSLLFVSAMASWCAQRRRPHARLPSLTTTLSGLLRYFKSLVGDLRSPARTKMIGIAQGLWAGGEDRVLDRFTVRLQ